ncbi:hypothetical protein HLB23_39475 [Nocardia uniformis]|uniref:Uncharacterized protein n=1 Tax=Nocardia uniformis TaxID=53432 RepID=A0A849CI54_9NOCA|nr:hypothetical protein [Nocardia uniformis]NNH75869.1 hypothetical protein [Nocardia uniformis]
MSVEYLDQWCCGKRMVKIPARPGDAPFHYLMHCYECGHYEPWDVDYEADTEHDTADTAQCEHVFRRAMNGFNDECVHCGLRIEVDEPDFTALGTDHGPQ